ncbi:MAG: hypothetical protein RIR86_88 [Acidobacteriota bacterium]
MRQSNRCRATPVKDGPSKHLFISTIICRNNSSQVGPGEVSSERLSTDKPAHRLTGRGGSASEGAGGGNGFIEIANPIVKLQLVDGAGNLADVRAGLVAKLEKMSSEQKGGRCGNLHSKLANPVEEAVDGRLLIRRGGRLDPGEEPRLDLEREATVVTVGG